MRRVGPDRFINPIQRTAAACTTINKDSAGAVEIELLPHFPDLVYRRGTKTFANRHSHPLDTPRRYTRRSQTLQSLIGGNKVAVDERRRPASPERRERIRHECVTRNRKTLVLD